MELNERIALARKQAGLSQEQLGDQLGVSRQAVSKWESGQTNPDVAYVVGMCRIFGVSADWLLTGEDSSSDTPPPRCPGCAAIITPLDDFCPKCGRGLRAKEDITYTLLLQPQVDGHTTMSALSLVQLSAKKGLRLWSETSPMLNLDNGSASALIQSAPRILDRGRTPEQVRTIMEDPAISNVVALYRDMDGTTVEELSKACPILVRELPKEEAPNSLSFGGTVLAVVVGLVLGVFLLSIL